MVLSFRRQRWTAILAFAAISTVLLALAFLASVLSWGFTLAFVASYGATTAVGQGMMRRLERRLRGGMRVEEVEKEYRRTVRINNVVLAVLFIVLLLLSRVI